MKTIKVVCGIIWKDDKVFIARRKPGKSMGGFWEFPGGKIEKNEKPEFALIRELREEFGMEVKVQNLLASNIHDYVDKTIELSAYACIFNYASFILTDHDSYDFVSINELNNYSFCSADISFVNKLTNATWQNTTL
jgi:8-oxo-dGTP diphosphatase